MQPIINLGYLRPLEAADIWPLPDATSIERLSESFESRWSEPAGGAAAVRGKAAMLRLLFRVFYADLLCSMALYLLVSPSSRFQHHFVTWAHVQARTRAHVWAQVIGANLAGPTLLRRMVIFIQTPAAPMSDGLLICAGFFFVQCIICLAQSHHDFIALRLGASARTMLMTATFRRCGCIRLPSAVRSSRPPALAVRLARAAMQPARLGRTGRFA